MKHFIWSISLSTLLFFSYTFLIAQNILHEKVNDITYHCFFYPVSSNADTISSIEFLRYIDTESIDNLINEHIRSIKYTFRFTKSIGITESYWEYSGEDSAGVDFLNNSKADFGSYSYLTGKKYTYSDSGELTYIEYFGQQRTTGALLVYDSIGNAESVRYLYENESGGEIEFSDTLWRFPLDSEVFDKPNRAFITRLVQKDIRERNNLSIPIKQIPTFFIFDVRNKRLKINGNDIDAFDEYLTDGDQLLFIFQINTFEVLCLFLK